jgi:hypothetical protein
MSMVPSALLFLYWLIVLSICLFLLLRGFAHSFIILFAVGAFLHCLTRVSAYLLHSGHAEPIATSLFFTRVLSFTGPLGMLSFLAGFVTLAVFLFELRAPANHTFW